MEKKKGRCTMEKDNRNAYSEVIEILKLVDDEKKLEALPMEMLEVLKSKANPEYKPQISKEIPLEEQQLQPETFSILAWITMKYWDEEIDNEEDKISNIEQEIEEDEQIDKNINEEEPKTEEIISTLPILCEDLKWYQKIKNKIIELFNRIFKRNKNEEGMNNEEEGSAL